MPDCPAATNLIAEVNDHDVILTWTAPAGNPTGYDISVNGTFLANVTVTTYTHTSVPDGMHTYAVKALFNEDCHPVTVSKRIAVGPCGEYVVGTGANTTYQFPVNTFYNYSYTQQIYTASEIDVPGAIYSISFQYIHGTPQTKTNQTIYLGNTTRTAFTGTSNWVPLSELDLVFTGTITYNNTNEWLTIELSEPFPYTGDNLVVAFLNNHGAYTTSSNNTFRMHDNATNRTLHAYNDYTGAINPASPPTASGMASTRNNIMFNICSSDIQCDGVTNLNATVVSPNHIHVTWTPIQTGRTWEVEFKKAGDANFITRPAVSVPEDNITGVSADTEYLIRVRYNCRANLSSDWDSVSVNTSHINILDISDIQIFPNPTTGKLQVTSDKLQVTNVEVLDVLGRVQNYSSLVTPHSSAITLDISHLSAGVYFVRIETNEGAVIRKIVKE